jgi:hypothetical protein
MKKMLLAVVPVMLIAGCAELPNLETADAKEEKYVMTGSHIARKNNGTANVRVADKEAMERQMQNQATTGGSQR